MSIPSETILEILKLGLIGLGFLLSFLAFLLLQNEQKRTGDVRKKMLTAIYFFMIFSFIFFVANTGFELFKLFSGKTELADANIKLNERNKQLEARLEMYSQSWIINGAFAVDYYSGGKDMKFYTIPPTDITPYFQDAGVTGFSLSNFRPIIINGQIEFPSIGFRSNIYDSKGPYEIRRDYDMVNDRELKIKLRDPILLIKKR